MCVYIYMDVYIHTYLNTHTHTYIYTHAYTLITELLCCTLETNTIF